MPRFVPRQRKHKVRNRLEQARGNIDVSTGNDSNAAEILATTITEKEKKRQDMQQPKIPSKKQKRLDKYIVRILSPEESQN